jgi:hypothetical protein
MQIPHANADDYRLTALRRSSDGAVYREFSMLFAFYRELPPVIVYTGRIYTFYHSHVTLKVSLRMHKCLRYSLRTSSNICPILHYTNRNT